MSSLVDEPELQVQTTSVAVGGGTLTVELEDGRTLSVPTAWYPRLHHGTPEEWANYEIGVSGIHWEDLDEDISISGLLLGRRSGESPKSIRRWLDERNTQGR